MKQVLSSPPIVMCVFLVLVYGLYRLGGKIAARGQDHPGKHQPYACGEELPSPRAQLTYHAFFKLALMFGMLHLTTLVLSTLPIGAARYQATAYLLGIGISVFVLTNGEL